MLTGHGGFSEYLTRFKCKVDPSCTCSPGIAETVLHVLLDCPTFGRARYDSEQEHGDQYNKESLPAIMADTKRRKTFLKFARRVVEVVAGRNS